MHDCQLGDDASVIEESNHSSWRRRCILQSQREHAHIKSMARQLIQSAQLLHLPIWLSAAYEMALPK